MAPLTLERGVVQLRAHSAVGPLCPFPPSRTKQDSRLYLLNILNPPLHRITLASLILLKFGKLVPTWNALP